MKIVDLHADIGYDVLQKRKAGQRNILKNDHVPKWQQGDVDTICMASFFDGHETWEEMQEMILTLKDEIAACDDIQLVQTQEDFFSPKIKAVLSVEGMCGIKEKECACIDWLHEQGVVLASLTWNDENYLATGAKGNPERGLSDAGIRAVQQMEKHHMIIDVSHANEKTFWDIMKHTSAMVIATHSNARCVCDHIRNLWDDQLLAIAERGGIIGAVAAPWFIDTDEKKWDAAHLCNHLMYMQKLLGIDHLALGFDFMDFFDGYEDSYVEGLRDASQAQNIICELQKNGLNSTDIEKISHINALNLLKQSYI